MNPQHKEELETMWDKINDMICDLYNVAECDENSSIASKSLMDAIEALNDAAVLIDRARKEPTR